MRPVTLLDIFQCVRRLSRLLVIGILNALSLPDDKLGCYFSRSI